MKFARRARQEVAINLTPLIDVVFLLLIFFMVSTTFIKENHLAIDLPEAGAGSGPAPDGRIEIAIARSGDYAVNGIALADRRADTLRAAIAQAGTGDNSAPMMITADSATPHQAVVTALDVAGNLGFTRISITTRLAKPAD